jgi:small subunit ribosomal protein S20
LPNIKSAKKRVLVAERNHARNVAAKSAVRTSVKKARLAVANKAENADAAVKAASISVDKAVTKGIMHKNTAARRKSRLAKALNESKA